ncbi:sugar ABC transporter permease [Nitratidesulfovibrio sp.]|uniref:carbohydrate ABC transporter permease n=1 Tax=Nitratidesulfovibrio sp. TaxID=2802297 RepID=UPI0033429251
MNHSALLHTPAEAGTDSGTGVAARSSAPPSLRAAASGASGPTGASDTTGASDVPGALAPRPGNGTPRPRNGARAVALALTVPGQVVSLLVLVLPLLVALYMSFTDWSPTRGSLFDAEFVGFENYGELLIYDTRFTYAVLRTLCISVVCLSLEFTFGLGLAVLFMREFRGKSLLFSAFLTPMMILPVVVGYIFWMLFQSNGPVNQVLELAFGAGAGVEWFRSASFAVLAVIITEVWHWTPLFFLILLSGLNSVPENPVRAAVILGASPRQVFWRVVMPMLKPVIIVAFVIRSMEIIKLFDEVFMLTRGGPGSSTETISLYIYKLAFNDFQLAYGAAAAFIVLIGSLVLVHLLLAPVRDQLLEGGRK